MPFRVQTVVPFAEPAACNADAAADAAPRISIIIPAWNAAATLGRTLESVLAQDFPGVEIIVVDDGSSDGTTQVAAAFARQVCLTVLHQRNQGVSVARNAGLAYARGRYVMFMDADDLLAPRALERRWTRAEAAGCEVLLDNAWWHAPGRAAAPLLSARLADWQGSGRAWLVERQGAGQLKHYVWLQFIRRDFLVETGLGFVPGITHQDIVWTNALLLKATQVCFSAQPAYHYFVTPGTLSHPGASGGRLAAATHYLRVAQELSRMAMDDRDASVQRALAQQTVQEGIAVLQIARRLDRVHRHALFNLVRRKHHLPRLLAHAQGWRQQWRILRRASRYLVWLAARQLGERLLHPAARLPVPEQPGAD